MKKIITIIVLCLSIFFIYDNVSAEVVSNNYRVVIEDEAALLTEQEEKLLYEEMLPLTEYGNIAFKSISYNDTNAGNYARNYYHSEFGTESGTLFLIDMYTREIYIFSDGNNYNYITDSKAYIITDNVYKLASYADYHGCASEAFSQIYTILAGGKISEPMRHISNGVLAIVCGFFVSFFIVLYNSRTKKVKTSAIIKNCDVNVVINNVVGEKTGTYRVYSPQSSSSGGSSGGGGGGGGGGSSSGGGGGHRF